MDQWGEAVRITLTGLAVVFGVMGVIAASTWASGRVFVALDRRAKDRKAAGGGAAEEKAETEGGR